MTDHTCIEIVDLNPAVAYQRRKIEQFVQACGLRYDDMDYYAAATDTATGEMAAGGGLCRDVIKCVAVAEKYRGAALANAIVSHLIARAGSEGVQCVKLYTKPENRRLFESLSFRLLAEAPEAILMETGIGGIESTERELRDMACKARLQGGALPPHTDVHTGAIVMNCNPFTIGHRWLIEQASRQADRLFVIVVREDCSMFAYGERRDMVARGTAHLPNVYVADGGCYAVSRATFPTYFIKRPDHAADTQMRLDIDLYRRHIAPALGATVRFVGSEPDDPLTRRYNETMKLMLPDVREMPRLKLDGRAVSASRVRQAIAKGCLADAARTADKAAIPYIIAHLATRALQAELDTTPKPGLVDRRDNGAHSDMGHALMQRSILTLHPYMARIATTAYKAEPPCRDEIAAIGIDAERAMLNATGGVNTHRGALFALGLAVAATAHLCHCGSTLTPAAIGRAIASMAAQWDYARGTHGSEVRHSTRAKGALDNAREGYSMLAGAWLPFYSALHHNADPYAMHKTLLRIMCDLDDTNIAYRTSADTMQGVKGEARRLLQHFSAAGLEEMNASFKARNISPGGSADMLSLVVFLHSVTQKQ